MHTNSHLRLRLFGALKSHAKTPEINVEVSAGDTSTHIKEKLKAVLKKSSPLFDEKLLDASVLSTEESILHDSDSVQNYSCLSVLPPVCGG